MLKYREGKKRYRYHSLEFWACCGMIAIIDERFPEDSPESFKMVMVGDFVKRLYVANKAIPKFKYADEREYEQTFIENGIKACKEAKSQGRPDDPKAVAEIARTRTRSMLYAGITEGGAHILKKGPKPYIPETSVLPPIPVAPASKPITPLVKPDN